MLKEELRGLTITLTVPSSDDELIAAALSLRVQPLYLMHRSRPTIFTVLLQAKPWLTDLLATIASPHAERFAHEQPETDTITTLILSEEA